MMRQRVTGVAVAAAAFVVAVSGCSVHRPDGGAVFAAPVSGTSAPGAQVDEALSALEELAVKGRAPKSLSHVGSFLKQANAAARWRNPAKCSPRRS